MNTIQVGSRFTLYAYALDGGRIRAIGNSRIKGEHGSKSIRDRWLSTSWPNTRAGWHVAAEWSADCNRRVGQKIRNAQVQS